MVVEKSQSSLGSLHILTLYLFTDFGNRIFVANSGRFLFEFEKWGGTQVFVVSLPEIVFFKFFPTLYF